MSLAELHPAYVWDCSECGRENFVRAIVAELSAEDRQELIDRGEDDTGLWMTRPDEVKCRHCGTEFDTTD